jgi:hypothetical protein
LASGNYKDILSSFYQLAVTNLTGPNKDLHFVFNPFAIMLRHDPSLAQNTNYIKKINQFWRRLNFDIDTKLDSSYHFNGFSLGLNYAIINKRDVTISKAFSNDMQYAKVLKYTRNEIIKYYNPRISQLNKLIQKNEFLKDSLTNLNLSSTLILPVSDSIDSFINSKNLLINLRDSYLIQENNAANDSTFTFDKLYPQLQALVKQIAADSGLIYVSNAITSNPKLNFSSERNKGYNSLIRSFQNKPLWTIGINDTSYSDGHLFKSMLISSEFLKGIGYPKNTGNIELDIKGSVNFTDDTLETGRSLQRQIFTLEPGINLVLKGKKNDQSYLEFKLSGSYVNILKGMLYSNEDRISNTINGTLRIRVFDEIWIPIEIKYGTKNHNVFGFLNVTTNFTGLSNLFKSKAK